VLKRSFPHSPRGRWNDLAPLWSVYPPFFFLRRFSLFGQFAVLNADYFPPLWEVALLSLLPWFFDGNPSSPAIGSDFRVGPHGRAVRLFFYNESPPAFLLSCPGILIGKPRPSFYPHPSGLDPFFLYLGFPVGFPLSPVAFQRHSFPPGRLDML